MAQEQFHEDPVACLHSQGQRRVSECANIDICVLLDKKRGDARGALDHVLYGFYLALEVRSLRLRYVTLGAGSGHRCLAGTQHGELLHAETQGGDTLAVLVVDEDT